MSEPTDSPSSQEPKSGVENVDIFFEKSKHFRVIHADGVWLNFGVNSTIRLIFYNESYAIPNQIVGKIENSILVGDDVPKRKYDNGAMNPVRELEVDVVLHIDTLSALVKVLQRNLEQIQNVAKSNNTQ